MYAVLVTVEMDAAVADQAAEVLKSEIIPRVKQTPGFVRGTWARILGSETVTGRSVILFETEEQAREVADGLRRDGAGPGAPVTVIGAEVAEVVAEA